MLTVGVDDGAVPARKRRGQHAPLLAVFFGGLQIVGVKLGHIQVDGRDVNEVLLSMLRRAQFDAVLLSGISFAGFNLADIARLARETEKPIVAVTGDKPDNVQVKRALRNHFDDWRERWSMVKAAGKLYSTKPLLGEPELYFEVSGVSARVAERIIRSTAVISRLPEPVRVAGILAKSLSGLGS